jgi:hypothetical protein
MPNIVQNHARGRNSRAEFGEKEWKKNSIDAGKVMVLSVINHSSISA